MPAYTIAVPDLAAHGPAIQVAIGPSRELITALAPLGRRLPSPHAVSALIDTGAHTTVFSPDLARRLGIAPVGTAPISTPSTTTPLTCDRYHLNLYFDQDFVVENIFAIEAPMGGVPFQCLIGRDVLRRATLLYNGWQSQFTLSFDPAR